MRRAIREKEEERLRLDGPLKRNLPLIAVIVGAFLVGPFLGEYIEEYRAIVLEVRGDQVFLGWGERKPPSWEGHVMGRSGDVLVKRLGSRSLSIEEPGEADGALVKLHQRYNQRYSGVVKALEAPLRPGSPHVGIITLSTGEELRLPVWSEELAETIAVGKKIEKMPGSWDPKVVSSQGRGEVTLERNGRRARGGETMEESGAQ